MARTMPPFDPTYTTPPDTTGVPVKSPSVTSTRHFCCIVGTAVAAGPPATVRLLARSAPYDGHSLWSAGAAAPADPGTTATAPAANTTATEAALPNLPQLIP